MNPKTEITVSSTYLQTILQLACDYHEELHETLHHVTLEEDVVSIQSVIESTEVLINQTKGYLQIPIEQTYCEQRCDQCGEDVDQYMLCPDGAEICHACFEQGKH